MQVCTGDACDDSHHTVIKLKKRDDAMARKIAHDHDMEIRVS